MYSVLAHKIHIFDYRDSRLSGLFRPVPKGPDNRGSTVLRRIQVLHYKILSCIHFKAKGHQTTVCLIFHPFTLCTVIYPPKTLLGNWLPQKSGKAYAKKRKINLS